MFYIFEIMASDAIHQYICSSDIDAVFLLAWAFQHNDAVKQFRIIDTSGPKDFGFSVQAFSKWVEKFDFNK